MQTIKLRTFIILSVAFHVVVISAIVLYFFKDPPTDGRSGTVMVGIISSDNNRPGKTSTSEKLTENSSKKKRVSKPHVLIKNQTAKKTLKKNTTKDKTVINKTKRAKQEENVKTTKKETKSTQPRTSEVAKKSKSYQGIETALTGKEGHPGSEQNQSSITAGYQNELAYPDYNLNPKPKYPKAARKRGYEGEVKLKVLVLENGRVGKIEVTRPSGYKILDESALEAVKNWIFVPGKENGKEISSWVTVPITFQLKSG